MALFAHRILSIGSALSRHKLWSVGGIFALLVLCLEWVGNAQTASSIALFVDEAMIRLFGIGFSALVATWQFNLAMKLILGVCVIVSLWRIGSLSEQNRIKLDADAKAREIERTRSDTELMIRLSGISTDLIRHFVMTSDQKHAKIAMTALDYEISRYAETMDRLKSSPQTLSRMMISVHFPNHSEGMANQINQASHWLSGNPRMVDFQVPSPHLTVADPPPNAHPPRPHCEFNPDANEGYFKAMADNFSLARQEEIRLSELMKQREIIIDGTMQAIERKARGQ